MPFTPYPFMIAPCRGLIIIWISLMCSTVADAQFTCDSIPYNPDVDCSGAIGYADLLAFLPLWGEPFEIEWDSLLLPTDLDPDPLNELQWLELSGDTLELWIADSVYSSVVLEGVGNNTGLSQHGVFDSSVDGDVFVVPEGVHALSIELTGASGGEGGDVCGQTVGASSCNVCDAQGGIGGRALRFNGMVYNLNPGDVISIVSSSQATDSQELLVCNPGLSGWTGWDCGPAESGGDADPTQLLLNGEIIVEVTGGAGGAGGCIGCQGDGCFQGATGANGAVGSVVNWLTTLSTYSIDENTGSKLVLRY